MGGGAGGAGTRGEGVGVGVGAAEGEDNGVGGGGAASGEVLRGVGCWEARATTAPPPPALLEEESRAASSPAMMATGAMPQHKTIMAAVPSDVQTHGLSSTDGGGVSVVVTKSG